MHWNGSAWTIVPSPNPAHAQRHQRGPPDPERRRGDLTDRRLGGREHLRHRLRQFPARQADRDALERHRMVAHLAPEPGGGGQLASVTASSPTSVWAAGAAQAHRSCTGTARRGRRRPSRRPGRPGRHDGHQRGARIGDRGLGGGHLRGAPSLIGHRPDRRRAGHLTTTCPARPRRQPLATFR